MQMQALNADKLVRAPRGVARVVHLGNHGVRVQSVVRPHARQQSTRFVSCPSSAVQAMEQDTLSSDSECEGECLLGSKVVVTVEKTSWNSRKLHATVAIDAPVELVWSRLTDYAGLGDFIPSLVENKVVKLIENGAQVYQVGAQDVAMGATFRATCTLDCVEWPAGIPEERTAKEGDGKDGLLPYPKDTMTQAPMKDISFELVKGDFKAFRGLWRLQPQFMGADGQYDSSTTRLCYSVYVKPQSWLPVGLISSRIQKEVLRNLEAVQIHAESLHSSSGSSSRGESD